MSIQLRGLHPEVRHRAELALRYAQLYRITPTVTSAYRSMQEQTVLRARFERCVADGTFRDGRTAGCQFPANRPGESAHNYGLAFDSAVPPHQQATWNALRRLLGFRVPETDLVHAEVPGWQQHV